MPVEAIGVGPARFFALATNSGTVFAGSFDVDDQELVVVDDERHRREVALHVVGELVVEHRVDRDRAHAREPERRCRRPPSARRSPPAIAPLAARLVLDDHARAELLAERIGDRSGDEVDGSAGRKRDDDARDALALTRRHARHEAREQQRCAIRRSMELSGAAPRAKALRGGRRMIYQLRAESNPAAAPNAPPAAEPRFPPAGVPRLPRCALK